MSIAVVINTKNSAKSIEETLKSVVWADEIVVVDMQSTDETKEIVGKYTNKIFEFEDVGYVEPARNFAISKATADWILVVDADEVVPESLITKLKSLTEQNESAWNIPRKNLIFGKWMQHTGWWPDYNIRFFRRGAVVWDNAIHSVPKVKGAIGVIDSDERYALIHNNYVDVNDFMNRMSRYTSIEESTKSSNSLNNKIIVRIWFDELFSRYFLKQGYKDGTHGLHATHLQMMYQLVTSLKAWEKQGYPEYDLPTDNEWREVIRDLKYWLADKKLRESNNPIVSFYWQIRRKLKI